MKKIISERIGSIIREKRKLEEALKVNLSHRGKELFIEGEPLEEYEAEKVIDALNFGFKIEIALIIKEKELSFEILNIKEFTKRKDMHEVRARIIGTKGKTLKTLADLTDCFIEVRENNVGIIGHPEKMKTVQEAIASLVRGSKQANVYSFLEHHHPKPVMDLGLKEKKSK